MLKAYDKWDTVMMPVHAADHAYLSFEKTALPVAKELGIGVQAIKIFGKANLLRSLNATECLRYALSQPGVHVAICGAGTQGQMEDNIRTAQSFKPMTRGRDCSHAKEGSDRRRRLHRTNARVLEEGLKGTICTTLKIAAHSCEKPGPSRPLGWLAVCYLPQPTGSSTAGVVSENSRCPASDSVART